MLAISNTLISPQHLLLTCPASLHRASIGPESGGMSDRFCVVMAMHSHNLKVAVVEDKAKRLDDANNTVNIALDLQPMRLTGGRVL